MHTRCWLIGRMTRNDILAHCKAREIETVIPSKRNRYLYRMRHVLENAFLHLKRWRGIATRYAKNTDSFVAAVQIRCLVLWANIL